MSDYRDYMGDPKKDLYRFFDFQKAIRIMTDRVVELALPKVIGLTMEKIGTASNVSEKVIRRTVSGFLQEGLLKVLDGIHNGEYDKDSEESHRQMKIIESFMTPQHAAEIKARCTQAADKLEEASTTLAIKKAVGKKIGQSIEIDEYEQVLDGLHDIIFDRLRDEAIIGVKHRLGIE